MKVQCYAGHTYAERPESFFWEETSHRVQQIRREWREPAKRCFLVCTENNRLFELCYHENKDEWSIEEKG